MTTKAKQWGNSLAIRIPKSLALEVGIKNNQSLTIQKRAGGIFILPIKTALASSKSQRALLALVRKISKANRYTEFDAGRPVGRELI